MKDEQNFQQTRMTKYCKLVVETLFHRHLKTIFMLLHQGFPWWGLCDKKVTSNRGIDGKVGLMSQIWKCFPHEGERIMKTM
jgi:hypothetical protein